MGRIPCCLPFLVLLCACGGGGGDGDYDSAALAADIGTLSTDTTIEVKSLAVTAAVQADVDAARTRSAYRLRFPIEADVDPGGDFVNFNEQEDPDGSGVIPVLVVRNRAP